MSGDAFPSGLVQVDLDDRLVDANAIFLGWVGATIDEVRGQPLDELVRSAEPTAVMTSDYLTGLAEVVHVNGTRLSAFLKRGVPDAAGNSFITVFDATQQRIFREQLLQRHGLVERTQKRLELVIAASIAFSETTSETRLGEVLATTTAQAYAAEESVVFLLDSDRVFRQVAGTNPFVGVDDVDVLTGRAAALRTVLKISGVAEAHAVAPAIGAAFERAGVQAMIIAPIHQRDEPMGIVAAFFRHPRQFDDQASPLADALAGQAARALSALRLQEQLEHAAMHDDTTGLPNRRFLEERMDAPAASVGSAVGVLFIDLDGFKKVNDRLGHHVGDEILREVAERLTSTIGGEGVVARFGGDEFVVVCDMAGSDAAIALAERVRLSLGQPYEILPHDLRICASIGVSVGSVESRSFATDKLVRAADQAMYTSKNDGGDRITFASD